MIHVPVLTIRQPWAWAIMNAGKDVENRRWPTAYRGPLAIHAAKGLTRTEYLEFVRFRQDMPDLPDTPHIDDLERGVILGITDLVDCTRDYDSPWFAGPFGFVLRCPVKLETPIQATGRLGLWYTNDGDVETALETLVIYS